MDEKKEADVLSAIDSATYVWEIYKGLVCHACGDDVESGQALFDTAANLCQMSASLARLRLDPQIEARVKQWLAETGCMVPLLMNGPPERTEP